MTSTVCPACKTEPAHHGGPCRRCWDTAKADLGALPWLWEQAGITRLRRDKLQAATEKVRGTHATPLPWNDHAATIMDHLQHVIGTWATVTISEYGATPPDQPVTVPKLIQLVRGHLTALRRHAFAGELAAAIASVRRDLVRLINRAEYRRILAGPCPEQPDTEWCTGSVWLIISADDPHLEPLAQCPACETQWDAEQFHRLGVRIKRREDALAKAEALAKAVAS
jgi:hypothetical protein